MSGLQPEFAVGLILSDVMKAEERAVVLSPRYEQYQQPGTSRSTSRKRTHLQANSCKSHIPLSHTQTKSKPKCKSKKCSTARYNLRIKRERYNNSPGLSDDCFADDDEDDTDGVDMDDDDDDPEYQARARTRAKCAIVERTRNLFRLPSSPLEVPHLLDKIMNLLPLKDWKACRQVNSAWKATCDNQIPKFLINIGNESKLIALVTRKKIWNNCSDIFTHVKLPLGANLSCQPLTRFFSGNKHIKCLIIPTMQWKIENLQKLLFISCPNLEELTFMGDIPIDSEARITDRLDANSQLPKLKSLSFYISNANDVQSIAAHFLGFFNSATNVWTKRLIVDLLSLAPNLEEVRCYNKRSSSRDPTLCQKVGIETQRLDTDVETSFTRVNQFLAQKLFSRTHNSNPKLKNLNMYLRLNSRGLEKLETKKYPLESLDLHVKVEDQSSMISLLTSLGKTLKHLRLKVDIRLVIKTECAFLSELETLHLEDYTGSLLFLQDIPKLRSLTLDRFDCRRFILVDNLPGLINSKMTSLSIENLRNPEKQGKCIKKIATFLPNIKSLSLNPATDNDLLRIFDSVPDLEHLKLRTHSISNIGLSGFTDADVENILDNGYELSRYDEYEKLRRMPYIGDLKSLKSLELLGDLGKLTPGCVTNRMICGMHGLWVMHGVGNLKHLRSLIVHEATLSSLELKYMVNSMTLSRLQLIHCRADAIAERWMRKKLFGKPTEFTFTRPSSQSM